MTSGHEIDRRRRSQNRRRDRARVQQVVALVALQRGDEQTSEVRDDRGDANQPRGADEDRLELLRQVEQAGPQPRGDDDDGDRERADPDQQPHGAADDRLHLRLFLPGLVQRDVADHRGHDPQLQELEIGQDRLEQHPDAEVRGVQPTDQERREEQRHQRADAEREVVRGDVADNRTTHADQTELRNPIRRMIFLYTLFSLRRDVAIGLQPNLTLKRKSTARSCVKISTRGSRYVSWPGRHNPWSTVNAHRMGRSLIASLVPASCSPKG